MFDSLKDFCGIKFSRDNVTKLFCYVLLMFLSYLFQGINCEVLFLHVLLIYYLYVY